MSEHRGSHFHRDRALSLTLLPCGRLEREELENLAQALTAEDVLATIAKEQPIP